MNGREFAGRLIAARPALKVLFTSGYTGEVLADRTGLDHRAAFLPKPVVPERLLRSARQVLDGVAEGG
jgi:two-component SAPR family response regulator